MKKRIVIIIFLLLILSVLVLADDIDGDLIEDDVDNCYNYYNPLQEDSNFDGIGDACDIEEITMSLNNGWNFVSFPLNYGLISAKSLNETLNGSLEMLYVMSQNESDLRWLVYFADYETKFSDFNVFDPTIPFWIKMKGDVNLTLRQPAILHAEQTFSSGWNLFGYVGIQQNEITSQLNNIPTISHIYAYNNPFWSLWLYGVPVNPLSTFIPGAGYWAYFTAATTVHYDNGVYS